MAHFAVAGVAGLVVSLLLERWTRPAPAAVAIHAGTFLGVWLLLAALLQRPFLAAGFALAVHALLLVLHASKLRALREPLLFSDYGLFGQAFRHPRLYLPYLNFRLAAVALAAFAAALGAGLAFESRGIAAEAWLAGALLAVSLLGFGLGPARPVASFDPTEDLARLGLLASGLVYWLAERAPLPAAEPPPAAVPSRGLGAPIVMQPGAPRCIVAVECESFFDARRLGGSVPRDVLPNFDALCAAGASGRLEVPAWGANTMRTEFAFLSGIAPGRLGVHRFNPYRRYARRPLMTLAARLQAQGYRTVCVHPYPASFFDRDRVFPLLGFDEFLDLSAFGDAPRDGAYVADAAVARKIEETLGRTTGPLFVFGITMENHGPQHLEAGPGGDALAVYLRHLRNADAMIGALADTLRPRSGLLCVFGDHVPSLPAAYAANRFDDPRTEYLIWRAGATTPSRQDLKTEELGALLLRTAGLAG